MATGSKFVDRKKDRLRNAGKLATGLRATSATETDVFTDVNLKRFSQDIISGRLPIKRPSISDDRVPGLRAIFRESGQISFHVQYSIGDSRPFLKIGDYPDMSIADARKIAEAIKHQATQGVDVQVELHTKLMRDLLTKGKSWKPST